MDTPLASGPRCNSSRHQLQRSDAHHRHHSTSPIKRWRDDFSLYRQRESAHYSYWHGYDLKKENGVWRITFHGDASHTIVGLSLSEQSHELEERHH